MINSIASRQIVDRVNAARGDKFEYRWKGTLTQWLSAHDEYVYLDALTCRLQLGPLGPRQLVAASGEAQPEDVERATQQILAYFDQMALAHAHAA